MFKTGLKHGVIVLAVVALATFLSALTKSVDIVSFTMFATALISWLCVGYFYHKRHGSFFPTVSNASQSKNKNNFWKYIFGIGLIWGPAKLLFSGYPITGLSLIENISIFIIGIPLSGIAVIFPVLIGSWLYKGNKTASNKAPQPTPKNGATEL